jgi:hypothetical protein
MRLVASFDNTMGKSIEAAIRGMINMCSGSSDYSFDILQPGRLRREAAAQEVTPDEVVLEERYNDFFQFPTMEELGSTALPLPTLLIAEGDPVLADLDKGYLDAIITNPFLLLENPALVEAITARLDDVIALGAARELFATAERRSSIGTRNPVKSPITGHPVVAAFTLGSDDSHEKATNYALANLLFGQKLVGQPELWVGVLYIILKKIPRLADNKEGFLSAYKDHMIRRMKSTKTAITLSGLPVTPMVRSPVDVCSHLVLCLEPAHSQQRDPR